MQSFRVESDFFGKKKVPTGAYYGISTVRSDEIFRINEKKMPLELIYAIVQIKRAAATANFELGQLSAGKKNAIVQVCNEILARKFDDQFILGVFQVGSGTPTHMNVNEVIASRASEILSGSRKKKVVDAHDDVNVSQSTNDVVPSAIRIAALNLIEELIESLEELHLELKKKSNEFSGILKSGRTHLQDATPITLGQEFGAYARAIEKHGQRLENSKNFLRELGIGGTAVGTGLNTFAQFRKKVVLHLNRFTKKNFVVSRDGIESTQFLTDAASVSGALKLLAVDLNKIAFDLRLMNSGPKTGFNEIVLPAVEVGSSIMPGKVNPSVPECVNMCCLQVFGNDLAVSMACANGVLELNTHMPLIASDLIESLKLLRNCCHIFARHCVKGIKANREKCEYYVGHSAAIATALNPLIGYEKVAELVKESLAKNVSVKELAVQKGYVSKADAKKFLNPKNLTKPNMNLYKKVRGKI